MVTMPEYTDLTDQSSACQKQLNISPGIYQIGLLG